MPGNRMSILGVARFCGQAPRLSSIGSQMSALQGTAFHAWCHDPDSPVTKNLLARLSPEQLEQVRDWRRPDPVEIDGMELRYETAATETEVGLNADGEYVPADHPDCVTVGHPDLYWGMPEVAVVVDIKRTEFTTLDGPESLQLHSYGLAVASKLGVPKYMTGQWSAIEGRYWWGNDVVDTWSPRADELRATIIAAAMNQDTSHMIGAHCRECYGREHCPSWLMPPSLADSELSPLVEGATTSESDLLRLLITTLRTEDTVKKAKRILGELASKRGGITDPATGKTWAPVEMPGRKSLSKELARADGVDLSRYEVAGNPYTQMRWLRKA